MKTRDYMCGVLDPQLEGTGQRIEELELLRTQLEEVMSEADHLPEAERLHMPVD